MGDDHGDDGGMRRRSLNKKRLMRVSTRAHEFTKEPTKLDQCYEGNIGMWVQRLKNDSSKGARQADELKAESAESMPPCKRHKHESHEDIYGEETDHILETLHKLKRWMRRMWRWGQCYTQYCYPSLRTVEYYRKVRESHKRKKQRAERRASRNSKKPNDASGNANNSSAPIGLSSDTSEAEIDSKPKTNKICREETTPPKMSHKISDSDEMPVPLRLATNEDDDSWLSWTEYLSRQFNDVTRTMAYYFSNAENPFQITIFFRWMCYFFLPAVLLLGVHYVFLKRRYNRLSGKLKRIKDENNALARESSKLESLLVNTEQLTMSMSTKESRAQAVADLTRLTESLISSKKEMNRMKTAKAALLEELKTARKKRDAAQKQYSSLANEILQNEHCIQT